MAKFKKGDKVWLRVGSRLYPETIFRVMPVRTEKRWWKVRELPQEYALEGSVPLEITTENTLIKRTKKFEGE